MHVGDMFLGKTLPFIDAENGNGGSAIEFGRTLTKVIDSVPDVDTIINGHWNTLLTWSDLVDYRGFYTDLYNQPRRAWTPASARRRRSPPTRNRRDTASTPRTRAAPASPSTPS